MVTKFCTQCGSEIAPGKRFCGRCGAPAQAQAEPAPDAPTPATTSGYPPANHRQPHPPEPAQPLPVALDPAPVASVVDPLPATQPLPSAQPQVQQPLPEAAPVPSLPIPRVDAKRRGLPRAVIAAVLAVLLLAGAGFGLYKWHNKTADETADDTSATTPAPDPSTTATSPTPSPNPPAATPAPDKAVPDKPSPDKTGTESSTSGPPALVTPTPAPLPARPAHPVAVPPVMPSPQPGPSPVRPTPAPLAPIVRQPPAPANSGTLRYAGPPVHPGEEISFNGLPGVMLRFSFDHSSWQPHITKHPDGTQTLTLRSITQQDQTRCEVQWQVAR